jgi:hypothetical protein
MITFKLKNFKEISDKSLGSDYVILNYTCIDGIKGITANFDIEVKSSNFYRPDGMIKMFGTMDEIYHHYNNSFP